MDRAEELKKQFILDWMPPFMEEYEPGAFEKDVDNLLQQYADEQSREIQEPLEDALYATGKFTTEQCTELAEGIIQYINEYNQDENDKKQQ